MSTFGLGNTKEGVKEDVRDAKQGVRDLKNEARAEAHELKSEAHDYKEGVKAKQQAVSGLAAPPAFSDLGKAANDVC